MASPKKWTAVTCLVLIVGTLIACGSPTSEPTPTIQGPSPTVTVPFEMPVTIAIAGRFPRLTQEALDEQIAAFEDANPDIFVEVVRSPKDPDERRHWTASKLSSGDTSIDIYVIDIPWPAEMAAQGDLVPLQDLLSRLETHPADSLPALVQANTVDGELVGLPWSADSALLFYRRDLLEKHGYAPPTTWEDLQSIALDVRDEEELPFGFVWQGAPGENLTCNTLEHMASQGGNLFDLAGNAAFDSPQNRTALEQMQDLVRSGASPQDTSAFDELEALSAFYDGEALFLRGWHSAWEVLNEGDAPVAGLVGAAALPASCLGGQSLALSAHSLNPEESLRLIAFLASYDQQAQMARSAGQPPALEAAYHDDALLATVPLLAELRSALDAAVIRPPLTSYGDISETIYRQVNQMLAGAQDVENTAARIQAGLESLLP